MQWYYSRGGVQNGPIDQAQLAAKIAAGEVTMNDLVWREGLQNWVAAGATAEFAGLSKPAIPNQPYAPPAAALGAAPVYATQDIPTYLWQSIVITLMCCLPFGIVAIIQASKVDGFKRSGDIAAAMQASKEAKKWCLVGLIGGLVVMAVYFMVIVLGAASNMPHAR